MFSSTIDHSELTQIIRDMVNDGYFKVYSPSGFDFDNKKVRESAEKLKESINKLEYEIDKGSAIESSKSLALKEGRTPDDGSFGKRPKIGRNDKCPCGSGRKYKACCLAHTCNSTH